MSTIIPSNSPASINTFCMWNLTSNQTFNVNITINTTSNYLIKL